MNSIILRNLFILLGLVTSLPVVAATEPNLESLTEIANLIRWSGVFMSIIVVFIAWLMLKFTQNIVDSIGSQFAQRRMLAQKLQSFFQFFVYMTAGISVFMLSFRVDDRVLTLIGGTLAVSVGFALKDLAASFIAGLTVMIDRPFQVGDRVTFEGHYGDIITIGLRSVRMQTLTDDIITIPNNKFLSDVVISGNYGALDMQVVIPFYVALNQDLTLASDIIREAAASSRYIHLPKPIVVLVKQDINDSYFAIKLTLKAYVLDIKFEKLFETDITLRVMQEFKKQNICPPSIMQSTKLSRE
ncbi:MULTISPECIES: mechanosensitive ion channel family protein [Shewanella]|uniref:Small-conductance mechanosensitive channel n=1 Tax=Shewanella fidelis TaxID=173509 RepID=A0AAW8NIF1_9GAMM|nr:MULTISPECIES: mechanosensitive ion channel domain-containing protein [Shewanella]MDR8522958.1 mechanosensitive ion channel [Shewanella fidelis]MDW4811716.1 mechanosensitive ion channel [Shewanella fidelis]MDW4815837.1 mechanosensitive ion channel [Shewanella fidelis]MDW4819927.1 mechanosensitive ion channel [Shewanella fidelis]MDW4824099.1 mechanosensitive ion channel [Shewanella fidelis]